MYKIYTAMFPDLNSGFAFQRYRNSSVLEY